MLSQLQRLRKGNWVNENSSPNIDSKEIDLVLCFGEKNALIEIDIYTQLNQKYTNAEIVVCSTAGEILQNYVYDESIVYAAIKFDNTELKSISIEIADFKNSYDAGLFLSDALAGEKLCNILVFSDGSMVNGSELVKGLAQSNVLVTGGLAGDGPNFASTLVGLNEKPTEGKIVAVGFYGDHLKVSHGSQGGWESFGLEREVTKSVENKLFEIDGENALDLYKRYLGDAAKELPGAALLYPLSVTIPGSSSPIVRTILSINEVDNSMVFAGDVPVGSKVRLMKANFEKLTYAASNAAMISAKNGLPDNSLGLLISCVGRKLVLGPRVEDEIEAVRETLGPNVPVIGFYSYGEISPFNDGGGCQLHNQTMTITTFYEVQ
jgi:hypothetical protein